MMRVTILGCGASMGVPVIGCKCSVCASPDSRNKRTRSSIMIRIADKIIMVDASLDFRAQLLRERVYHIDALLMTHIHADHSGGLSDIVVLKTSRGDKIPVYADVVTMNQIVSAYSYFFVPNNVSAKWCEYGPINPMIVAPYERYEIDSSLNFIPVMQNHGLVHSIGYIFNDSFAYCTDVKAFPQKSVDMLKNKKLLILSCAKIKSTMGHASFSSCMEFIAELNPEMCVLTHMSHDFEYGEFAEKLKSFHCKIIPAHDGMEIDVG